MKVIRILLMGMVMLCAACSGEDRSGEQPFAPTVAMLDAYVEGLSVTLYGRVLASPNSSLSSCGFKYGNNEGVSTITCEKAEEFFRAQVDSLEPGRYFAAATATNKIGSSQSDTLWFQVEADD
ncbi:MAG: hypothetical protein IJ244_06755 [Bacteroidaceae bacterium]|nr:hypothetical protein [Bacteroidaceae bacterium]